MQKSKLFFPLLLTLGTTLMTITALADDTTTRTISFSGYDWEIREQGISGPGPNHWDSKNVWLDKAGNLHLKITKVNNEWRCAEVISLKKFGFGRYEFQTIGRVDKLDRNIVLGLFDYPVPGEDPDATNEIDIEFARWGNDKWPNGNFTIYPATGAVGKNNSHTFEYALPENTPGMVATHRFTRAKDRVILETLAGEKSLARWVYAPPEQRLIPQKALAVHINLWLSDGRVPSDGKEVEVVIKRFTFTP